MKKSSDARALAEAWALKNQVQSMGEVSTVTPQQMQQFLYETMFAGRPKRLTNVKSSQSNKQNQNVKKSRSRSPKQNNNVLIYRSRSRSPKQNKNVRKSMIQAEVANALMNLHYQNAPFTLLSMKYNL